MATMTDKMADQIAQKTVKRFEDAGRDAVFVTVEDEGGIMYSTENLDSEKLMEVFTNLMYSLSPSEDDFIYNLKAIKKMAKKARKKYDKCEKRA